MSKNRLRHSRERASTSLLYDSGSRALIWKRFWRRLPGPGLHASAPCSGPPFGAVFVHAAPARRDPRPWALLLHAAHDRWCFYFPRVAIVPNFGFRDRRVAANAATFSWRRILFYSIQGICPSLCWKMIFTAKIFFSYLRKLFWILSCKVSMYSSSTYAFLFSFSIFRRRSALKFPRRKSFFRNIR